MPNWDDPGEEYPGQRSGCSGIGPCTCPTGKPAPEPKHYRPRNRYPPNWWGWVNDDNGNEGFPDDFDDNEYEYGADDWRWNSNTNTKEVRPYKVGRQGCRAMSKREIDAVYKFIDSLPLEDQDDALRIAGLKPKGSQATKR